MGTGELFTFSPVDGMQDKIDFETPTNDKPDFYIGIKSRKT
jgi:hypothetical protein